MLKRAVRMWHVASKVVIFNVSATLLTSACRYHVPSFVHEHIDYITPGISLREVTGVKRSRIEQRRSGGKIPPILEPILLPIEELLSGATSLCSLAVTPQCIQSK